MVSCISDGTSAVVAFIEGHRLDGDARTISSGIQRIDEFVLVIAVRIWALQLTQTILLQADRLARHTQRFNLVTRFLVASFDFAQFARRLL